MAIQTDFVSDTLASERDKNNQLSTLLLNAWNGRKTVVIVRVDNETTKGWQLFYEN
jgi:hypothetical protein